MNKNPLYKKMPQAIKDLRQSANQKQRDASRKQFKERMLQQPQSMGPASR